MIVYGTKSTKLIVEPIGNQCTNCLTIHTMDMYILQRYAHVFYIPMFPVGKTGVSQCNHCRQVLKLKHMPASLKFTYEKVKKQTRTPIWTWAGTVIILAVLIFELRRRW
ncbi:hypothetical protein [Mucilaginibacter boryungensis]|uniref:Zinc ribbon family protein n=1 Tax=Mucilaginibacter boryungensis TaxID=768480 RepID=A0ABR9XF35_9SPHI|nr:hypothetical protein [Mucilaginibacter boryungensis]MBE9665881.1 hypothetical protein [Mucilaginibacter boryungensis]